ncbi:MAG: hypothetical protein DHS20C16_27730 [Phycisphaerae bacterium]|nr:MAG: hypothetical protein DHS20C16_27730 [Phycisphaerae bacterium]
MRDFIAIDFETANSRRVSACAIGYARVVDGEITESQEYLIKPVGGHAPFQSQIHGITDEHTSRMPSFEALFPMLEECFGLPLVAYSRFDQQVLDALSDYFGLGLHFEYTDACLIARERLPHLKNHKLKSLVKHFRLPKFKHHNAREDAIACASVFLKLQEMAPTSVPVEAPKQRGFSDFKSLIDDILADGEVDYTDAYALLYCLEDNKDLRSRFQTLYDYTSLAIQDCNFDTFERDNVRELLFEALDEL